MDNHHKNTVQYRNVIKCPNLLMEHQVSPSVRVSTLDRPTDFTSGLFNLLFSFTYCHQFLYPKLQLSEFTFRTETMNYRYTGTCSMNYRQGVKGVDILPLLLSSLEYLNNTFHINYYTHFMERILNCISFVSYLKLIIITAIIIT